MILEQPRRCVSCLRGKTLPGLEGMAGAWKEPNECRASGTDPGQETVPHGGNRFCNSRGGVKSRTSVPSVSFRRHPGQVLRLRDGRGVRTGLLHQPRTVRRLPVVQGGVPVPAVSSHRTSLPKASAPLTPPRTPPGRTSAPRSSRARSGGSRRRAHGGLRPEFPV